MSEDDDKVLQWSRLQEQSALASMLNALALEAF